MNTSRELEILREVISIGNVATSSLQLMRDTLDVALRLLDFDTGATFLINYDKRIFEATYQKGAAEGFLKELGTVSIDGKRYRGLLEGKPMISEDYPASIPVAAEWELLSMACIPFVSKGKVIGVMDLFSKKRFHFPESMVQTLIAIGRVVGESLARVMAEE